MTSKQRAYLRGIGHPMPATVQVGKEGLGETLFQSVAKALTHRELLKINVLKSCEEPMRTVADAIAGAVEAEVVQVIGRKILLYKWNEDLAKKGEALVLPQ